ncbi:hypothetical protein SB759_19780 [Pseudomonas sp. SIMBA_059]|uniref:hypothetical protein n=1 Tax=Pseudomonas palleroniana TaxID=191390 RepID=UPI0018E6CBE0|nr:hypothetical protein [Pseudomonas palleroniana]MBI6910885.1 hypothetical protein [Pseudomonas palleroniana]
MFDPLTVIDRFSLASAPSGVLVQMHHATWCIRTPAWGIALHYPDARMSYFHAPKTKEIL